ncbi:Protein tilB homolog [Geodia barretti]|uniref:Protein tilB homolog n=1 Tax=Geodia barretti TaxID=519541 RepID=A0AA35T743_GEOBA|nr:Protein tilB homolog [Geodia barretti]
MVHFLPMSILSNGALQQRSAAPQETVRLERDGKMLNVNEARYDFQLRDDDENNQFVLEVAIPRYVTCTAHTENP